MQDYYQNASRLQQNYLMKRAIERENKLTKDERTAKIHAMFEGMRYILDTAF